VSHLVDSVWCLSYCVQQVRMAYLALVASHTVNGVAAIHSDLIKTTIFKVGTATQPRPPNAFPTAVLRVDTRA
jgi:glucan phosphorylase